VCLFDAVRGVLAPVEQGDAIRIHTQLPEMLGWESLEIAVVRPFVVYELLRRVLEYEGLSGRFVYEPQEGGETIFEPFGERALEEESDGPLCPGTLEEGAEPSGGEAGRCIELFLSGTDGPVEQSPHTAGLWPKLSEALEQFGRPALVVHLLSVHYSQPLGDPLSGLREASARVEHIREVAVTLRSEEPSPAEMGHYLETFRLGLGCDLDTRLAFRVLFEWLREAELREDAVGDRDLREMLALLELEELVADVGVE
jgi:hypothetical protein